MAKTYLNTVKYEVQAVYEITGIVEKPDIIGAIFGQSEGLLGSDMDLKELQQNGKLGRIEISVKKGKGKTFGEITIPSSLDQIKTSILAATVETVDKVGPCEAKIQVKKIIDTRKDKREHITDRAKQLLQRMQKYEGVESNEIATSIRSDIRTGKIVNIHGLTAGPDAEKSKEIIIVEGRADVLKLLEIGIKTAVAMDGSNISKELIDFCKNKTVTLLTDGDRGGDLNAKKLASMTNINYVARAPDGKEVEELTQKEILQTLKRRQEYTQRTQSYNNNKYQNNSYPRRDNSSYEKRGNSSYSRRDNSSQDRTNNRYDRNNRYNRDNSYSRDNNYSRDSYKPRYDPYQQSYRPKKEEEKHETKIEEKQITNKKEIKKTQPKQETKKETLDLKKFEKDFQKIKGKKKARLFDNKNKKIKDVSIKEAVETISKSRKKVNTILIDGIVTKRLIETAEEKNINNIIGVRKSKVKSDKVNIYTM